MGLRKHLHASNSQITWFSCWLLTFTNGDHYLYFRWDFHPWRKKNEKELIYVIVGCLLVILGGILLGYMKTV